MKEDFRRGKQRKKMDGLTKWIKVGRVTDKKKEMRDSGAWTVVIAFAEEQGI